MRVFKDGGGGELAAQMGITHVRDSAMNKRMRDKAEKEVGLCEWVGLGWG